MHQFLTQRTIQTFMLLLTKMRDPHTSRWIEDFIGSKSLLNYHGTGAMDTEAFPNWDSAFNEIMEQPPDIVLVEIEASNSARGLSKNNPYRDQEVSVLFIVMS